MMVGAFLFAWRKLQVGPPMPTMAIDEAKRIRETVATPSRPARAVRDPPGAVRNRGLMSTTNPTRSGAVAARTPEEIRASIEQNRQELGTSLVRLRDEVSQLTDWRAQVRRNREQLTVAAAAAGFVLAGGIGGASTLLFGRGRRRRKRAGSGAVSEQAARNTAGAEQARPDVRSDHRPHLRHERRVGSEDLSASCLQGRRLRRAPECAGRPRRRRPRAGSLRGARRGARMPAATFGPARPG